MKHDKTKKAGKKWKGEKVKKIEKVISILENALISDFVFSLLAWVCGADAVRCWLFVCFVPRRWCLYSTLYHACDALSYQPLRKWLNDLRPCLWPFKDFASVFACVFSSRVAEGIGEPVLTAVAWCQPMMICTPRRPQTHARTSILPYVNFFVIFKFSPHTNFFYFFNSCPT